MKEIMEKEMQEREKEAELQGFREVPLPKYFFFSPLLFFFFFFFFFFQQIFMAKNIFIIQVQ